MSESISYTSLFLIPVLMSHTQSVFLRILHSFRALGFLLLIVVTTLVSLLLLFLGSASLFTPPEVETGTRNALPGVLMASLHDTHLPVLGLQWHQASNSPRLATIELEMETDTRIADSPEEEEGMLVDVDADTLMHMGDASPLMSTQVDSGGC